MAPAEAAPIAVSGRCPRPVAPERGRCAVAGAVPAVPGHRTRAREQSLFQSATYFGLGGRVTMRMRCLSGAAATRLVV